MKMEGGGISESYYSVLGVSCDSSFEQIRRAYRKLAMRWHPDRWASNPSLLGEAKRRFQKIHEAYSVLSDPAKRQVYDAGFYDPRDEIDEGFCSFMQEMLDLMAQVKEEEKGCSLEELQSMFSELVQTFDTPAPGWYTGPNNIGCSSTTSRSEHRSGGRHAADMEVFGMSGYCR